MAQRKGKAGAKCDLTTETKLFWAVQHRGGAVTGSRRGFLGLWFWGLCVVENRKTPVAQRRTEAVGVAFGRQPSRHAVCAPSQEQAEYVAEIVSRIGQQRHRIGQQAKNYLRDNQHDVENSGNREGAAEVRG